MTKNVIFALFTTLRILWQVKTEPGTTADSTSEFRAPEKSPKSPKSEKVFYVYGSYSVK